jgi:hypothetical protein
VTSQNLLDHLEFVVGENLVEFGYEPCMHVVQDDLDSFDAQEHLEERSEFEVLQNALESPVVLLVAIRTWDTQGYMRLEELSLVDM